MSYNPERLNQEEAPQVETYVSPALEQLQQKRQEFISDLHGRGLISADLADSGELDAFALDEATEHDSLKHILVGDKNGGAHHLATIIGAEVTERVVASQIFDPDRAANKLRREQSVRESGAYRSRHVEIEGRTKAGGSSMFPNEWSTEATIRNILAVSRMPAAKHDLERASFSHDAEIDGVRINVITDEKTGKIITAAPKISQK